MIIVGMRRQGYIWDWMVVVRGEVAQGDDRGWDTQKERALANNALSRFSGQCLI